MSKNLTTEEMKKIAANSKKTKIAAHANQYGQWVKQKRKEKRISQKDLCEMAEISTVYLSKIENGFDSEFIKFAKSFSAGLLRAV